MKRSGGQSIGSDDAGDPGMAGVRRHAYRALASAGARSAGRPARRARLSRRVFAGGLRDLRAARLELLRESHRDTRAAPAARVDSGHRLADDAPHVLRALPDPARILEPEPGLDADGAGGGQHGRSRCAPDHAASGLHGRRARGSRALSGQSSADRPRVLRRDGDLCGRRLRPSGLAPATRGRRRARAVLRGDFLPSLRRDRFGAQSLRLRRAPAARPARRRGLYAAIFLFHHRIFA